MRYGVVFRAFFTRQRRTRVPNRAGAQSVASGGFVTILRRECGPIAARAWFFGLARHESSQRRDHRPCRPWQDHAGRPAAAAVRLLPREPAGGRARAWIPTISSASAASPSSPRRPRSSGKDTRINIVDTPGHADFGGEVERILNMVDGALVLVDAAEGPLPQTKFVVVQGAQDGAQADRGHQQGRPRRTRGRRRSSTRCSTCSPRSTPARSSSIFRSSTARPSEGWMAASPDGPKDAGMAPLFDLVLRHVKPPQVEDGPFRLLGTILEANPYLGRIVTGRITSGSVKPNQPVKVLDRDGKLIEQGRVTKVLAFRGLERTAVEEGGSRRHRRRSPGLPEATVAHTICAPAVETPTPGAADRSADAGDDVPRQRFAARRHRGRQGHRPHDPRPAVARSRRQRGAARARVRPRRIRWRSPAAANCSSAS